MKYARDSKASRPVSTNVRSRLTKAEARSLRRTIDEARPDVRARSISDARFEELQMKLAESRARTSQLIDEFSNAVRAISQAESAAGQSPAPEYSGAGAAIGKELRP